MFICFEHHPAMLRTCSWFRDQEIIPDGLRGLYGVVGMKLRLVLCKENPLLTVLLLWSLILNFQKGS